MLLVLPEKRDVNLLDVHQSERRWEVWRRDGWTTCQSPKQKTNGAASALPYRQVTWARKRTASRPVEALVEAKRVKELQKHPQLHTNDDTEFIAPLCWSTTNILDDLQYLPTSESGCFTAETHGKRGKRQWVKATLLWNFKTVCWISEKQRKVKIVCRKHRNFWFFSIF